MLPYNNNVNNTLAYRKEERSAFHMEMNRGRLVVQANICNLVKDERIGVMETNEMVIWT